MGQSMTDRALVFDTHAHVLSADLARYPHSTLRGGAKPPVSPLVFTVQELVRQLDAGGVAHACIVQRATLYGYDNRYALDSAAAYPARSTRRTRPRPRCCTSWRPVTGSVACASLRRS
jgi:predicted TIM-barrel fold metal-dependent hydrolase